MLKKLVLFLSFIILSAFLTSFKPVPKQQVLKTIIIDAGHGIMASGGHNGAKGRYSHEDEICLAIAKKLVAKNKQVFYEVKVIETRPTERIVDLRERANIAYRKYGTLIIS